MGQGLKSVPSPRIFGADASLLIVYTNRYKQRETNSVVMRRWCTPQHQLFRYSHTLTLYYKTLTVSQFQALRAHNPGAFSQLHIFALCISKHFLPTTRAHSKTAPETGTLVRSRTRATTEVVPGSNFRSFLVWMTAFLKPDATPWTKIVKKVKNVVLVSHWSHHTFCTLWPWDCLSIGLLWKRKYTPAVRSRILSKLILASCKHVCVILRSRVLLVVCPHWGCRSDYWTMTFTQNL